MISRKTKIVVTIGPSSISKSMINKTLKEKIAFEAQNLNMLKEKVAKLPL